LSPNSNALEKTTLMSWTTAEIEGQIERNPKLGLALIQTMVACCVEREERLESLALNPMAARLAVGLLQLAKDGTPEADGVVRIPTLTHQIVAGYVGTSREMVTSVLNPWRHRGIVQYSRKGIQIYPDALTKELQRSPADSRDKIA
jgi:CRP-like cAMP-binding protein